MAITGVEPRVGPLNGEQPVTIQGRNFRGDIGYTIYFGNKKADNISIQDSTRIVALAPSREEPGAVDITVRADDGAAFRIPGGFRYEDQRAGGGSPAKTTKLAY